VQVDPWGKFKFMLLRVKDRNGRQVLLVRGANNSSESVIVEELHKQVRLTGATAVMCTLACVTALAQAQSCRWNCA
jgi:hypothetical protein